MRVISLIRHGEYSPTPEGGVLTARGRRQAKATGKRLLERGCDAIYTSTLSRAQESADLIAAVHAKTVKPPKAYLQESWPSGVAGYHVPLEKRRQGRERIETIIAKHFKKARGQKHDLLVCHGNIIRGVLAMALGMKLTTWAKMFIHHGSLTQLAVQDSGRISLVHYNDVGHFAPSLVTHALMKTRPR